MCGMVYNYHGIGGGDVHVLVLRYMSPFSPVTDRIDVVKMVRRSGMISNVLCIYDP